MRALLSKPSLHAGTHPCIQHRRQQQQVQHRNVRVAASRSWQDEWAFRRLTMLPGGAWFMAADADAEAPVYGDSFIMQGNRQYGAAQQQHATSTATGLITLRGQRPARAVLRHQHQSKDIIPLSLDEVEVSIVVIPASKGARLALTSTTTTTSSSSTTSIVPFRRLLADAAVSDEELQLSVTTTSTSSSSSSLAIVPRDSSTMLGVVVGSAVRSRGDAVPLPTDETVYETPFNDKNPRRTMKIKFTCKRCGATTIKPVNPHAWTAGTVFAKCGCCQVTHKLIDNLKLFHELAGPVFGPGTQAPPSPRRERLGLRLDSDTNLPLPPRLRLRLNPDQFPDDTAVMN